MRFKPKPKESLLCWYEESGRLGGCDGWDVDLEDMTITSMYGSTEPITMEHADNVKYVIKKLMEWNKEELGVIDSKLNQVEDEVRIPIDNGYKIRKKPSDAMRKILEDRKLQRNAKIDELGAIDVVKLIKDKNGN